MQAFQSAGSVDGLAKVYDSRHASRRLDHVATEQAAGSARLANTGKLNSPVSCSS
jgi:hypothetical protein